MHADVALSPDHGDKPPSIRSFPQKIKAVSSLNSLRNYNADFDHEGSKVPVQSPRVPLGCPRAFPVCF
jgi:hypothetical protein